MIPTETEVLVLGAGLAGMAAAGELGGDAVVLEREERPGGLVRAELMGGHWFDHVLHLLYFPDPETEGKVRGIVGEALVPCPAEAFVETRAGVARFPLQCHLGTLEREAVVRCVSDLARAAAGGGPPPAHYEEMLLRTFGRELCDLFFLPYNRKMWRRPLDALAPSGFQWNIARPALEDVLRGALAGGEAPAAPGRTWYPRPPAGAEVRGMEVLSRALARRVERLALGVEARVIDLDRREVWGRDRAGREVRLRWRRACVGTLPLPTMVLACPQAPPSLKAACRELAWNRVWTVAFAIRGPRPRGRGHWRYYPDEAVPFTRLVHMHEFDPMSAPEDGWSLLAEVPEPGGAPPPPVADLVRRVREGLHRVGALPPGSRIVNERVIAADPAYVVFDAGSAGTLARARTFLEGRGLWPLGRYGRWEYSSMGGVMRDGFALGRELRAGPPASAVGTESSRGALAP